MSADTVGLKLQPCIHSYAAATKTATVIAKGAIVFPSRRNNCVYKCLVEIQDMGEKQGQMTCAEFCHVFRKCCLLTPNSVRVEFAFANL